MNACAHALTRGFAALAIEEVAGVPHDFLGIRTDPRFREHYSLQYLELTDGRWSPVFVREGFALERVWKPAP